MRDYLVIGIDGALADEIVGYHYEWHDTIINDMLLL